MADISHKHIVFVCTGNTCRSPMAAALLRYALGTQMAPLRDMQVISTGLATSHGASASPNAIHALKNIGIDISAHQSRPLTQELLDGAIAVFAMTSQHLRAIRSMFSRVPNDTYLMRHFMDGDISRETPDPYGMGLAEYENCRDSMVESIPSLVNFLRKLTGEIPKTEH